MLKKSLNKKLSLTIVLYCMWPFENPCNCNEYYHYFLFFDKWLNMEFIFHCTNILKQRLIILIKYVIKVCYTNSKYKTVGVCFQQSYFTVCDLCVSVKNLISIWIRSDAKLLTISDWTWNLFHTVQIY